MHRNNFVTPHSGIQLPLLFPLPPACAHTVETILLAPSKAGGRSQREGGEDEEEEEEEFGVGPGRRRQTIGSSGGRYN